MITIYLNYKITNLIDGKVYIGYHIGYDNDSYLCSSGNKHFWNAIRKYEPKCTGLSVDDIKKFYAKNRFINFKKETIQYFEDEESMHEGEKYWIEFYRNLLGWENVYNLLPGGYGGWDYAHKLAEEKYGTANGFTLTPEARAKARLTMYDTNRANHDGILAINSKDSINKSISTRRERYGSAGPIGINPELYEKVKATTIERYGALMTHCHSEDAIKLANEMHVFKLSENKYIVRTKKLKNYKVKGYERLCPISDWLTYCSTHNLDPDLINYKEYLDKD